MIEIDLDDFLQLSILERSDLKNNPKLQQKLILSYHFYLQKKLSEPCFDHFKVLVNKVSVDFFQNNQFLKFLYYKDLDLAPIFQAFHV